MIYINFVIPKSINREKLKEFSFNLDKDWSFIKDGDWAWIIQTYCHLRNSTDIKIKLSDNVEEDAINYLSSTDYIQLKNKYKYYCISFVQDRLVYYPSQLIITQNLEHKPCTPYQYIPLWSQAGIIKKDHSLINRDVRIGFFGLVSNLVDVKQIIEKINQPTSFLVRDSSNWNDYSDIDIAIGIRDFSYKKHIQKPATKLINAWKAQVPFIGGYDSAFNQVGTVDEDFLLAETENDLINAINRILNEQGLKEKLISNGSKKYLDYSDCSIFEKWSQLFLSQNDKYYNWKNQSSVIRFFVQIYCHSYYILLKVKRRMVNYGKS